MKFIKHLVKQLINLGLADYVLVHWENLKFKDDLDNLLLTESLK